MSKNRNKLAIINIASNISYQIINILMNLILPPLIIAKFGSSINGLVSTTRQIVGYVQLLGAGISESSVVSLYKPIAQKDQKGISSIYNATSHSFFRAGVLFCIVSCLLAAIYPLTINSQLSYLSTTLLVMVICIGGASEFFVTGKCRALLMANQQLYIVNMVQIIGAVCNVLITIILLNLNMNIIIVQLGGTIIFFMRLILLSIYVNKKFKFLDKKVPPNQEAIVKRKAATIHQLAALVLLGSQTIIITTFCGLEEASVFSVYSLVFTGVSTLCGTVSSALLATFGNMIHQESNTVISKSFRVYETIYYILIFVIYATAFVLILPFIELYVVNSPDISYTRPITGALFCITVLLNNIRTPGITLIMAYGHYDETVSRAIIEMTICLIGQLVLVTLFGINGVLIATMLAYIYRSCDVIHYVNHIITKGSVFVSVKTIFVNIVLFFISVSVCTVINYEISNFFEWAIAGILYVLINLIIILLGNIIFNKKIIISIHSKEN